MHQIHQNFSHKDILLQVCKVFASSGRTFAAMTAILEEYQEGKLLLIDKPQQWTSFDAVKKIRVTARVKKVGHAGTLDPLATGLLLICTGKFTKRIQELSGLDKEYTGTIVLGAVTDSYDLETEPKNAVNCDGITEAEVVKAMMSLTGRIEQYPPVYSAVKIDGTRAYARARKGEEVQMKSRTVEVESFELLDYTNPVVSFKVKCSKGTYIRSLAHDLGQILGCGAYLGSLRRTAIGDYSVEDAQGILEWASEINALREV